MKKKSVADRRRVHEAMLFAPMPCERPDRERDRTVRETGPCETGPSESPVRVRDRTVWATEPGERPDHENAVLETEPSETGCDSAERLNPYRGTSLIRNSAPLDPTVGLCLGPYGGLGAEGCFL